MIPRRGIANGVLQAPFNVKSLFAKGEQGVWYDPSDLSTLFQDSAGTTPVTAVGQPVGKMLDKSGCGNHATQVTTASRPVLSARVNLLTKTEDLGNVVWSKGCSNATTAPLVTASYALAPNGEMTANRVVITPPGNGEWSLVRIVNKMNLAAGQSFTQSIYVKATDASQIGKKVCLYSYNITTTTYGIISQTTLTGDWQKVSVTQAFVSASTQQEFSIGKARAAALGQNGTIGITDVETATDFLVWGAQLELGQTVSRYQIVNTSTDYDTAGFPMYLSCDGVDDGMATASIDFSPTDKMTVWTGIRKLSDAAQGVLVELSANASSNAGSFNISAPNSAAANYSIRSGGTTSQTNTITTYTAPISNVITGVLDIGNDILTARVNGVEIATVTSDQGTGNFGNYPLYLFRRGGTTLPFNGNLYGLVIRGAASNPKQIAQVEKYLAAKAGVSI